jgi:two-component system, cell cycle sensor histidine kinase and response regulator CckA
VVQPLSAITDPTELRLRSEMMLRMAGNLARFGGWSLDVETNTNFWSDELCQILGYPVGSPPRVSEAYALYPAEDREVVGAAMAACAQDGIPFDQVHNMHDAGGRLLRVRIVGEAIRDAEGRISHVEGAFHDVTAQEAEHDARLAVEARLASTLDSLSDGLILFDGDWRYSYLNPRAQHMLGLESRDVLGRVFWEIAPAEVQNTFGTVLKEAVAQKRTLSARHYHSVIGLWLEVTAYPSDAGLVVYLRDVSQEESVGRDSAAKAEIIASQAALLDIARDAILVRGLDHTVRYWNKAAEDLYGWTPSEAIGRSVRDLIYDDPDAFDAATDAVLKDGQWFGDIEQRSRDGRRITAECSWTLVRDAAGTPQSIFAVNTDMTSRRREDDLNLRRQRMESLGTLASGIAHDLNNVLAPMLLGVQLLSTTETNPQRLSLLATMEGSVKRGADMIRQVLSFARGVEGKRIVVDVVRLLSDLEAFGREALPSNVTLTMRVPKTLWHTVGDPIQLLQVLVNLITNARDALPNGGTITITASDAELNGDYASVSHLAGPGRYVAIDVEDNGTGMTPDVVDRVFEPFFTTKEAGSGTGLGLASSLAIARAHGGYMQVYSEPGRGSRFQLHLLAASGESVKPISSEVGAITTLPTGRGENILVVDDEEAIRRLTRQTLELYGYRTMGAGNGADALVAIAQNDPAVDLVLTDMMMPVMDGADLAAELAKTHPELPIVAMSGLNANGGVARASLTGVRHFLPKPFTTETLVRFVSESLSGEVAPDE